MDQTPPAYSNINATGTSPGMQVDLPDTGATKPKRRKRDPMVGLVKSLNANRDLNVTHVFDYFLLSDEELSDDPEFNRLHRKVIENRRQFNNFAGTPQVDFTNFSPSEIQYYNDFLGINFKKIGNAIGHAATSVGNSVRNVAVGAAHGVAAGATAIGHVARDFGSDIGHVAVGTAHVTRDFGTDFGHVVRTGATVVGHGTRAVALDVAHGTRAVGVAVAPYWKILGSAALVAVLAASGVGLPVALAIGSATLTGLDAIKPADPTLPPGFGSGAGQDLGGAGGDATGAIDDSDDDNDTGDGLSPAEQAQKAQAQAAQAAAYEAQAEAIAKRKKLIYWGVGIAAALALLYFFRKKL